MPDREKVIKGLECCINNERATPDCMRCPYAEINGICIGLHKLHGDAIALLKAQEPREPHYTRLQYMVNGMPVAVEHPECPRCFDNGLLLWDAEIERGAKFCKRCGQAVKWE